MNILETNRSEMADPHPRDSAYLNVGHTSRQDPRGNRPSSQDRLRDSRNVRNIRDMFWDKKKGLLGDNLTRRARVENLFFTTPKLVRLLYGSLFNRNIVQIIIYIYIYIYNQIELLSHQERYLFSTFF